MSDDIQRADYDSPWKIILESYFRDALEFFFPKTAAIIDWTVPPVFLNKEFQAISYDAVQGRRYADEPDASKGRTSGSKREGREIILPLDLTIARRVGKRV